MLNTHVDQNELSIATDTPRITEQGLALALRGAGTNRTSADAGSGGHCHRVDQALHEALIEARHNPETVHSLFALAKEGVPLEFLSHYLPDLHLCML